MTQVCHYSMKGQHLSGESPRGARTYTWNSGGNNQSDVTHKDWNYAIWYGSVLFNSTTNNVCIK